MNLTLEAARTIIAAGFAHAKETGLKPLAIVVLDAGGHPIAFERQDGASPGRFKIAFGKANGCIMLGLPGSAIQTRAEAQAFFVGALNGLFDGAFVPVQGGVLIKDSKGAILGAVGVTGDTSENDAAAAVAGITSAGFTPQA